MDFEIVLSYTTAGAELKVDCDDEDLEAILHDDEEFQELLSDLLARFTVLASEYDAG